MVEAEGIYDPIGTWVTLIPKNSPIAVGVGAIIPATCFVATGWDFWIYAFVATAWRSAAVNVGVPSSQYATSVRMQLLSGEENPINPVDQWQPTNAMFGTAKQPAFLPRLWYWPGGTTMKLDVRNDSGAALVTQFSCRAYRKPTSK